MKPKTRNTVVHKMPSNMIIIHVNICYQMPTDAEKKHSRWKIAKGMDAES